MLGECFEGGSRPVPGKAYRPHIICAERCYSFELVKIDARVWRRYSAPLGAIPVQSKRFSREHFRAVTYSPHVIRGQYLYSSQVAITDIRPVDLGPFRTIPV